jgi:hypothetical protein
MIIFFAVGGGVLDSGLADLETELATWYTWNVLQTWQNTLRFRQPYTSRRYQMLAIGTGGLDVALAAAGEPYYVKMPKMGIKLIGKLPNWVSAKDIVLKCFADTM